MNASDTPRVAAARRGFLRGRVHRSEAAPRPPWALAEAAFIERCTRCDHCIDACPSAIIVRMDGGFPGIDFTRGECSLCGDCVARCEAGALVRRAAGDRPWDLVAAIGAACLATRGVECRVCGESCPTGAIRFRPQPGGVARPQLDALECTGCGACVGPCPARAISMLSESRLPTEKET
ncbi:MAG: ferredoxin-type protein NapF [Thauera phenolivorans]|uniref:Ferredoxin-type protein NapF n=1 Tax=Thauera phenolivorans TaxID=1792543 RepID=A0A7X7LZ84_9RHOO|nr:ferredoxin-type protein NapF [Thauera phenolivorans]